MGDSERVGRVRISHYILLLLSLNVRGEVIAYNTEWRKTWTYSILIKRGGID